MADRILNVRPKQELEPQGELGVDRPLFMPPVDIYEEDDSLVLLVDLPGVKEEDVDIHVEDNVLTLKAKVQEILKEAVPLQQEFKFGDLYRRFTLSNLVDQEKITATLRDGVLKVILPKAEAKKPKRIQVTAG